MPVRRILVSWIGTADLAAMLQDLPEAERARLSGLVKAPAKAGDPPGPLKTATSAEAFDHVHLLTNFPRPVNQAFVKWLGCRPRPRGGAHRPDGLRPGVPGGGRGAGEGVPAGRRVEHPAEPRHAGDGGRLGAARQEPLPGRVLPDLSRRITSDRPFRTTSSTTSCRNSCATRT